MSQKPDSGSVGDISSRRVSSKLNGVAVKPTPSWVSAPDVNVVDCLFLFFFCGFQATLKPPAASLTLIADVLARIANSDGGLALFLQEKSVVAAQGER